MISDCSLGCFRNSLVIRIILVKVVRGDVPEEVRLKPSSGRMGMIGGEGGQRAQGHRHSEGKLLPSGRWTGVSCVHLSCVLSGPTLVTSVSCAAQGAGQVASCQPCQRETKRSSYATVFKMKS